MLENGFWTELHQRTKSGWGGVKLSHPILLNHPPVTRWIWKSGNAFEHEGGGAVDQGTVDDIRITCDLANVRHASVHIIGLDVENHLVRE